MRRQQPHVAARPPLKLKPCTAASVRSVFVESKQEKARLRTLNKKATKQKKEQFKITFGQDVGSEHHKKKRRVSSSSSAKSKQWVPENVEEKAKLSDYNWMLPKAWSSSQHWNPTFREKVEREFKEAVKRYELPNRNGKTVRELAENPQNYIYGKDKTGIKKKFLLVYVHSLEEYQSKKMGGNRTQQQQQQLLQPETFFFRGLTRSQTPIIVTLKNVRPFFYVRLAKGETVDSFRKEWDNVVLASIRKSNKSEAWIARDRPGFARREEGEEEEGGEEKEEKQKRQQQQQPKSALMKPPIELSFCIRWPLTSYQSRMQGQYQTLAKISCLNWYVRMIVLTHTIKSRFAIDKRAIIKHNLEEDAKAKFGKSVIKKKKESPDDGEDDYDDDEQEQERGEEGEEEDSKENSEIYIENLEDLQDCKDESPPWDKIIDKREVLHHSDVRFIDMVFSEFMRIPPLDPENPTVDLCQPLKEIKRAQGELPSRLQVPGWIAIRNWEEQHATTNPFRISCVINVAMEDVFPIEKDKKIPFGPENILVQPLPILQNPPLVALAFDIETFHITGTKFATDPTREGNFVMMIGCAFYYTTDMKTPIRQPLVLMLAPFDIDALLADPKYAEIKEHKARFPVVIPCQSEMELLSKFRHIGLDLNQPEVLVGHNISTFDLNFLIARSNFYSTQNHNHSTPKFIPLEWTCIKNYPTEYVGLRRKHVERLYGVHIWDTLRIVKAFVGKGFENYKLGTLAAAILGSNASSSTASAASAASLSKVIKDKSCCAETTTTTLLSTEESQIIRDILTQLRPEDENKKKTLAYDMMAPYFARGYILPVYWLLFLVYVESDILIPGKLIEQKGLVPLMENFARLTNVSFYDLIFLGQQIRLLNRMYMEIEWSYRYINYDHLWIWLKLQKQSYKGGNVLKSSRVYSHGILHTGDFAGLYPSVAQEYVIGYSSVALDHSQRKAAIEDGYKILKMPLPGNILKDGHLYFVQMPVEEDPFCHAMEDLAIERTLAKNRMKTAKTALEKAQHNGAQLALKTVQNSGYGGNGTRIDIKDFLNCPSILLSEIAFGLLNSTKRSKLSASEKRKIDMLEKYGIRQQSNKMYTKFPIGQKQIGYGICRQGRGAQAIAERLLKDYGYFSIGGDTDSLFSVGPSDIAKITETNAKLGNPVDIEKLKSLLVKWEENLVPILKTYSRSSSITVATDLIKEQSLVDAQVRLIMWNLFTKVTRAVCEHWKGTKVMDYTPENIFTEAIFFAMKHYECLKFEKDELESLAPPKRKSRGMETRDKPPLVREFYKKLVAILLNPINDLDRAFGSIGFTFSPQHPAAKIIIEERFRAALNFVAQEPLKLLESGKIPIDKLILTQEYEEGKENRVTSIAARMKARGSPIELGDRIGFLKMKSKKGASIIGAGGLKKIIENAVKDSGEKKSKANETAKAENFEEVTYFLAHPKECVLDIEWYLVGLVKLAAVVLVRPQGGLTVDELSQIFDPIFAKIRTKGEDVSVWNNKRKSS